MPRKLPDIPPEVARAFVVDMRAFFAENNGSSHKADEIAARQAWALSQYLGPQEKPIRIQDVKQMFLRLRDEF